MCEKVVEMLIYAKYGASDCILLHMGHKVMMAGTTLKTDKLQLSMKTNHNDPCMCRRGIYH